MTITDELPDAPPEGWEGDPVEFWRRRHAAAARTVEHLERVLMDAVALLHEVGRHEEADRLEASFGAF